METAHQHSDAEAALSQVSQVERGRAGVSLGSNLHSLSFILQLEFHSTINAAPLNFCELLLSWLCDPNFRSFCYIPMRQNRDQTAIGSILIDKRY